MAQLGYKHLIHDVRSNNGGQIMLSNHLINFLYSFAFHSHAGLKYPSTRTNDNNIEKTVNKNTSSLLNTSTSQLAHASYLQRYAKTEGNLHSSTPTRTALSLRSLPTTRSNSTPGSFPNICAPTALPLHMMYSCTRSGAVIPHVRSV